MQSITFGATPGKTPPIRTNNSAQFIREHGNLLTSRNLATDPTAASVKDQYKALRRGLHSPQVGKFPSQPSGGDTYVSKSSSTTPPGKQ